MPFSRALAQSEKQTEFKHGTITKRGVSAVRRTLFYSEEISK